MPSELVCMAQAASTGSPIGPVTRVIWRLKPAEMAASTVPSPPSATGTQRTSAGEIVERRPLLSATATSSAVADPLNLSAAITMTACVLIGLTVNPAAWEQLGHLLR